jgi:hypothetical protein
MKVRRPFCSGCSTATRLLLLGAACLIVVVLTHVAEALQVFAFMGWVCFLPKADIDGAFAGVGLTRYDAVS